MKKTLRLIAALLVFCFTATCFPPTGLAAGRTTHILTDGGELLTALASASNGDTIQCSGLISVGTSDGTDAPWVIDKNVTIEGGTLTVHRGGIVLNADVTFRNTTIDFTTSMRNAIMANGHTLVLDGVTTSNFSFNLFCGGLILGHEEGQFTVPAPGSMGEIIIQGNTCLQGKDSYGMGNIYAGNLCIGGTDEAHNKPEHNGAPNQFSGNARIRIENHGDPGSGVLPLGQIYAGGAQQRIPVGAAGGKQTTPDPDNYTVSGTVTIEGAKIPSVDGFGSGATNIVYQGNAYLASKTWSGISQLTVETGHLNLEPGSSFRDDPALSVNSGAKLNLAGLNCDLTASSFQGGGSIALGLDQCLTISGQVEGQTGVATGGFSNNASSSRPIDGHTYLQAPQSTDTSFQLLPHSSSPNASLVRDSSGNWTVTGGTSSGDDKLITSFRFVDKQIASSPGEEAAFEMETFIENGDYSYLDYLCLSITINWSTTLTPRADPDGIYEYIYQDNLGEFYAYVADNTLCITSAECGAFTISVSLPRDAVAGGKTLSDTAALTVSGDSTPPDPSLTPIPIPEAVSGLIYTGEEQTGVHEGTGYTLTGHTGTSAGTYTATATLDSGYCWADGTTSPKQILWSIASPAVNSIQVSSTGHKTDYTVGEALDVSGLTIEALYSNGERETLPVTADMVSGFDSSQPAERQTLTIWYEGQSAAYTIQITAAQTPEPPGHSHLWSETWDTDASAHWHSCGADQCPIVENSQKDGYAPHTAGEWIVDQEATATQSGSRYQACVVCGREMARDTIPATGGSSGDSSGDNGSGDNGSGDNDSGDNGSGDNGSGDNGSGDNGSGDNGSGDNGSGDNGSSGGSSGGSSSGGSSDSGSSGGTVSHPDGSTTSTSTNHSTGAVTDTTRRPDGSQTIIETQKDGTVTTTEKAADGSTVKTTEKPDGSSETSVRQADGSSADIRRERDGRTEAVVTLSSQRVDSAQHTGAAVSLPIPPLPLSRETTSTVSVHTGSGQPVKVEIPAQPLPGAVAVLVHPDGTQTVVRTSTPTERGILASIPDGATVKLVDNRKDFGDTGSHWAKDAIDFVSARELFSGKTPFSFAPDSPMTRAMVTTVLAQLDGVDTAGGAVWYENGLNWAVAHGISDGKNPGQLATREQFVSMLYRYAGNPAATEKELNFADADQVSGYAREAMRWAVENGFLSGFGDGTLAPDGQTTRAQAAAMLKRYMEIMVP